MPYWVQVEVENISGSDQTFTIPAGFIFMPKQLGKGQCLVSTQNTAATIPSGQKKTILVPTECIDPPLPPPANIPMVATTFGPKKRLRDPFRRAI